MGCSRECLVGQDLVTTRTFDCQVSRTALPQNRCAGSKRGSDVHDCRKEIVINLDPFGCIKRCRSRFGHDNRHHLSGMANFFDGDRVVWWYEARRTIRVYEREVWWKCLARDWLQLLRSIVAPGQHV